jgi:hypothetical protein
VKFFAKYLNMPVVTEPDESRISTTQ